MKKMLTTVIAMMAGLSLYAGVEKGELLSSYNFNEPDRIQGKIEGYGLLKDGVYLIENNMIAMPLDSDKLKGVIIVEAKIKADINETPEKPYFGAKLMLVIEGNNGKTSYPEPATLKRSGTYDWETVSMVCAVPEDVKKITFMGGVQNVKGKFYIDTLKVYRGVEK